MRNSVSITHSENATKCKMCNMNERIERFKNDINDLRKEVQDLKETVMQQNELIITLLSKQTGSLDEDEDIDAEQLQPNSNYDMRAIDFAKFLPLEGIKAEQIEPLANYEKRANDIIRCLPLKNIHDLLKFEAEIKEETKAHLVGIIQSLLSPLGLMENIVSIFSKNFILELSVDGHFHNTRLKDFPKTLDVLYLANRKEDDYTANMFLKDLRLTLKVIKNRKNNRNKNRSKKLLRQEEEKEEQSSIVKLTNNEEEQLEPLDNNEIQANDKRRFPLKNVEDLKKFETEIHEANKTHIVSTIQTLVSPSGLMRSIVNVLSDNIIMESNLDGYFYKTRLLNFPKTMDVLYLANRKTDDYTLERFFEDLKRCLRVNKNRWYKNNCRARKRRLLHQEKEKLEQKNKQSFTVKTAEVYFPPSHTLESN